MTKIENTATILRVGDEMHYFSEEVGIVNGIYRGTDNPFSKKLGLHQFEDMTGNLCLGQLCQMEIGHHKKGKKKWSAAKGA